MSNIVTSKFAGLLRGLLRRFDENGTSVVAPLRPMVATPRPPASSSSTTSQSKSQTFIAPQVAASAGNVGGLQLPLPSIIAVLPIDLRAKLMATPPTDAFVTIPVEKVLSQLAHGSVKISFGELRTARPGLFASSGTENDARQIALPLNEIVTRISPTLLSRRAVKKVELTEDVTGPFGARTQSFNFTPATAPAKSAPTLPPMAPGSVSGPAAPKSEMPTIFVPKTTATALRLAPVVPVPAATTATAPTTLVKPDFSAPPQVANGHFQLSPAPATPAVDSLNSAAQMPVENPILAPLSALAEKWPDAIKMELVQTDLMSAQVALPAELIETGLKRGRVPILWKNLRMMIRPKPAPVSVHDGVEVELPLKVLAPQFFASQKSAGQAKQKISVSEEIPDLFQSSKSAGAAISTFTMPARVPAPTPALAPVAPAPVAPVPSKPIQPFSDATTITPVAPVAQDTPEQEIISAPLAALSEKWPEALRNEIAGWNLENAQVALSLNGVAPAMKRGRVTMTWRDLHPSIRPTPPATASVHDDTELELPLKVIAPLFLERQTSTARPQKRLAVDQSIPSPFSPVAAPEMKAPVAMPAAAPAPEPPRPALKPVDAKLSETNFYVWGDTSDTPRVDDSEYKRPQAPATDFTSRHATPKEIVARAITLPGVAGVVVALCDGLMIASHVPPDLNADTVAAFLPQIFDRVAQCTRELRMGTLNNLKFTVGNVPWQIFHVNAIYFAAFGRAGESLPKAQLIALAGELNRKKQ